jgi:hypothetical protein
MLLLLLTLEKKEVVRLSNQNKKKHQLQARDIFEY